MCRHFDTTTFVVCKLNCYSLSDWTGFHWIDSIWVNFYEWNELPFHLVWVVDHFYSMCVINWALMFKYSNFWRRHRNRIKTQLNHRQAKWCYDWDGSVFRRWHLERWLTVHQNTRNHVLHSRSHNNLKLRTKNFYAFRSS